MTAESGGFVRAIAIFALASAAGVAAPSAFAGTQLCNQLEARLASASKPLPRNTAKYDAAIAKQREQIVRVRNRSQIAGCGLADVNRGIEDCGRLNANLANMERNLGVLQRKRDGLVTARRAASPDQILAELAANGCREPAQQQLNAADDSIPAVQSTEDITTADVEQDTAAVSKTMADTPAQSLETIAGNPPAPEAPLMEADPTKSSSIVRPETVAAPVKSESATQANASEQLPEHDLDPNRRVRVVGPTFLPDPEEAIDLRAPGRKRAQ
ncbi:hypothetical protein C7441_102417 [Pseudaminobacter salicylatoxidans]|uniref:Uncharacterized protein n=1 Tax=Pseudaminobacter salicylatoxidans TaxID=93369 RepID=A0A316CD04_PSESE|nr:hypothetical protein [Pseudaminobacter salicylatoxidans]PWJ85967.1 hypothetical protein C7441_102417 [Pseudaminobacter salicylatoxidans]